MYFAGLEFHLSFQINVFGGQDSFFKIRIQSFYGDIQLGVMWYNLIRRLTLKNQGRDAQIFLA